LADDYRPPKAKDAAAHRMKVCAQPKRAWPRRRVALRGLKLKQKYRNSCNSQPEKPAGLKPDAVNPVWKLYEPEAASAYRSESERATHFGRRFFAWFGFGHRKRHRF
jgi:hypothetical protein